MLGGLPLALEIAAAHLGKWVGKPIAAYRDDVLRRGALAVIDDRRGGVRDVDLGTRHAAAMEATLAVEWDNLTSGDAACCCVLPASSPKPPSSRRRGWGC